MKVIVKGENGYCPECGGGDMREAGVVWSGRKRMRNYRCQGCGRQTVYPLPKPNKQILEAVKA